jgi:NAD+ synthase
MSMQEKIRNELHVKPCIDPKKEIEERVQFLKEYLLKTKANGYVLGISGGQDSSLAGRLAQLAVEQLREEGQNVKFIAVRLPYGMQKDEEDAQNALNFIQADEEYTFNIAKAVDSVQEEYNKIINGEPLRDYHKGNVKARMRMIAQYVIGGQENLLVIGTDHAAEAVTGFYTKFGDGGADIVPLAGLTKRQGKALLQELGAEEQIYLKVPTADLLDNKPQQADETELGITYDLLDDYLEGKTVPQEIAEKIEKRYVATQHKREQPVIMYDEWWK